MTISTRGIRTPNDGDDWDLTLDLAAMAVTIDDAIGAGLKTSSVKAASTGERTALFPIPAQGDRVYRTDYGWEEAYFASYNATTNPSGAAPAGWYPTGIGPSFIAQRSGLGVANGANANALTGGAALSPSPLITLSAAGVITVGQPGEYELSISSNQPDVNGSGQRTISVGGSATILNGVTSQTYLAMGSIQNGIYAGRFNIRVSAANQTVIPAVLQNSGTASLPMSTQVSLKYMGPNHG